MWQSRLCLTLDHDRWYLALSPKSGSKVGIVSVEAVTLLCLSTKLREVEFVSSVQPYYSGVWEGLSPPQMASSITALMRRFMQKKRKLLNPLRNSRIIEVFVGNMRPHLMPSFPFNYINVVNLLAQEIL